MGASVSDRRSSGISCHQRVYRPFAKVGRSIKKNPPTVLALIRNIQHRGALPQINSIIDIYNVESLKSFLAIGGHDLDKIEGPIEFTVSQRDDLSSRSFLVKNMSHRQILSTGIKKEFWLGWMYAIVTITNLRRLRKTPSLSSRKYRDVSRDAFRSTGANPQGPCSLHASASI